MSERVRQLSYGKGSHDTQSCPQPPNQAFARYPQIARHSRRSARFKLQASQIAAIWTGIAAELGVDGPMALPGRHRGGAVFARQIAMYAAYHLTGASLPMIAAAFGKADHTTALYACRKVAARRAERDVARALRAARVALSRPAPALTVVTSAPPATAAVRREREPSEAKDKLRAFLDDYGRRTQVERSVS